MTLSSVTVTPCVHPVLCTFQNVGKGSHASCLMQFIPGVIKSDFKEEKSRCPATFT